MYGIDENNWVDAIKRTGLPILNLGKDFIRHIRNKALTAFKSVDIFNLIRNLSCRKSSGIHTDNNIINRGYILLPILNYLRLKGSIAILWNINRHLTVFTANLLGFRSVTVIIGIKALGFLITQMF